MRTFHTISADTVDPRTLEVRRSHALTASHPTTSQAWTWGDGDALMVYRDQGQMPVYVIRLLDVVWAVPSDTLVEALASLGENVIGYQFVTTDPTADVAALLARWKANSVTQAQMASALLTGAVQCSLVNSGPSLTTNLHNLLHSAARCALVAGVSVREFYNTALAAYNTVRAGKMEIKS